MNNALGKQIHNIVTRSMKLPISSISADFSRWEGMPRDEIKTRQWEKLQNLIRWAYENSPYYRTLFTRIGAVPEDIVDRHALSQIPVLTKETIRDFREEIVVRPASGALLKAKTSGSTGKPLLIYKDRVFLASTYAAMYRGHSWHGVGVGSREARLWGVPFSTAGRYRMLAKDFLLNRIRQQSVKVSDHLFEKFTVRLRSFKPVYLMGYPSFVYLFAHYLKNVGYDGRSFNFRFVKITAEQLPDYQKDLIESVFGCNCISEYGAAETGIISFECPERSHHIISPSVFVEFLDAHQVEDSRGKDIVVSCLYSHSFPIIRYRLGDLGYPLNGDCRCGMTLPMMSNVVGRLSDVVIGREKEYHSAVFSYLMKRFIEKGINATQYRFIQEEPGRIIMEIESDAGTSSSADTQAMKDVIVDYFGDDLYFQFSPVPEIKRTSAGKHRYFVSKVQNRSAAGTGSS